MVKQIQLHRWQITNSLSTIVVYKEEDYSIRQLTLIWEIAKQRRERRSTLTRRRLHDWKSDDKWQPQQRLHQTDGEIIMRRIVERTDLRNERTSFAAFEKRLIGRHCVWWRKQSFYNKVTDDRLIERNIKERTEGQQANNSLLSYNSHSNILIALYKRTVVSSYKLISIVAYINDLVQYDHSDYWHCDIVRNKNKLRIFLQFAFCISAHSFGMSPQLYFTW